MNIIRHKSILLSCAISLMYSSGLAATFISILTLAFSGYPLTPFVVFTLLSIINVLRNSALRSIGEGSQFIYEAYVSFARIQEFLLLPNAYCTTNNKPAINASGNTLLGKKCFETERIEGLKEIKDADIPDNKIQGYGSFGATNLGLSQEDEQIQTTADAKCPNKAKRITLTNLTSKRDDQYISLKSIKFEEQDQNLIIITGPVGSGKSTLLSLIAGEMPVTEGNIQCCGAVAYVPQMPWVFSGTLRENILFGRPFDLDKYIRTIRACALEEDIEGFPDKDQVIVGERGDTLSGGQQVRISLARAVYADCDIYLLDNPLAALDMNVSNHIFKHCILGLLSNKVRLMVSHQESHMKLANKVIVLHNGSMIDKGTFVELNEKETLKEILEPYNNAEKKSFQEQMPTTKVQCSHNKMIKSMGIPDEDRAIGAVSFKLYWDYLTAGAHPITLAGLLFIFLFCQGKALYQNTTDFTLYGVPLTRLFSLDQLITVAIMAIRNLMFSLVCSNTM